MVLRTYLLAALAVLQFAGCGYSFGTGISADVKTVRVDMAGRWPLKPRGMEFELTREVKEAVERNSHCRSGGADADAVVKLRITSYKVGAVAGGLADRFADSNLLVELDVNITLKGREHFDGNISEREPFSPARGDTEEEARRRVTEKLARKVLDLMADW